MNRFNLTFQGEILPGEDPVRARARFAALFQINDAKQLEDMFCGEPVVLRENLERKEAGEYYAKMREIGLASKLEKVEPEGTTYAAPRSSKPRRRKNKKRQAARSKANPSTPPKTAASPDRETPPPPNQEAAPKSRDAFPKSTLGEHYQTEEGKKRTSQLIVARMKAAASRKEEEEERKRERKAKAAAIKEARAEERRQRQLEAAVLKAAEAESARLYKLQQAERRERLAQARVERAEQRAERRKRTAQALDRNNRGDGLALRGLGERARLLQRDRVQPDPAHAASTSVYERRLSLAQQALADGASALRRTAKLRSQNRVRSRLELPRRSTAYHAGARRQPPGSPNIYRLQAFRNTLKVRQRAQVVAAERRRAYMIGTIALALLLILTGGFLSQQPPEPVPGPTALAASQSGKLAMLFGETLLLHDRAGVPEASIKLKQLGIADPGSTMLYLDEDEILLQGRVLPGSGAEDESSERKLWRCDLVEVHCEAFAAALEGLDANAAVRQASSGDLILADGSTSTLVKLGSEGQLLAKASHSLQAQPSLRLDSGLLLLNSTESPAVSVLRYEDAAFGQQLDEILLLPPQAIARKQTRVLDFVGGADFWWVTLYNPDSNSADAYLFDRHWNFVKPLESAHASRSSRWLNWGGRMLLYDNRSLEVQRFSSLGELETPFNSESLQEILDHDADFLSLRQSAWHLAMLLCAVVTALAYIHAMANGLRYRIYRNRPTRGADPLDDVSDHIEWVPVNAGRRMRLRRMVIGYSLLAIGLVMAAIGLEISPAYLLALLVTVSGPFIALQMLERNPVDHVGLLDDSLVLVDHKEVYHVGSGQRLQKRGPFLAIDDVIVYTGSWLLPALDPEEFELIAEPLLADATFMDMNTLQILLRDSHHPLANGALAIVAALLMGLFVVAVGHLPW